MRKTRKQQLDLFNAKSQMTFGGADLIGRRKGKRILSTKNSIHMTLKANAHSLLKNERFVHKVWSKFAKKFGVRTYKLTVNSNHVHALFKIHSRALYARFIQALTGTLANRLKIKWMQRPFTRLVTWGKAFWRAKNYIEMNFLEAQNFIEHQPRGRGSLKKRFWLSGATT